MQVTVNIPDELAAQVIASGSTPESYVENMLSGRADILLARRPTKEDFDAALNGLARFSDKIPDLPDEAFTRASFYQDHD